MIRILLRTAARRQSAPNTPRPISRECVGLPFHQRRNLGGISTILLPPVVFGGLVITLWTWKCLMMVVFQNKIIYMPGLPPNARREKIEDYKSQCSGIEWKEENIKAIDGTQLSLCVADVETASNSLRTVYILYFQGNASSLPPRLPFLSPILRMLRVNPASESAVRYKMVCCSYRGYWKSRGRPSEKGLVKDAHAALEWIKEDDIASRLSSGNTTVVIWGQSIGAGVAARLAAGASLQPANLTIDTLILETPFISIKSMLETLYPQKWLPYRHLWPFLRNHLDTPKALSMFSESKRKATKVLILDAGKDELVPKFHADDLERLCVELGFDVKRHTVDGALHTEAIIRQDGKITVVEAIQRSGIETT